MKAPIFKIGAFLVPVFKSEQRFKTNYTLSATNMVPS